MMAEAHICGHTEEHGGRFEWVCVLPPHGEIDTFRGHNQGTQRVHSHYFKAFEKAA